MTYKRKIIYFLSGDLVVRSTCPRLVLSLQCDQGDTTRAQELFLTPSELGDRALRDSDSLVISLVIANIISVISIGDYQ